MSGSIEVKYNTHNHNRTFLQA